MKHYAVAEIDITNPSWVATYDVLDDPLAAALQVVT
jgi:hypothetical protein